MDTNDIKYVMLPRIEDQPKHVKHQPWYKERIREKYLNKKDNKNKTRLLDAKQWVFIKDGLDDFRDGLPPPHDDLLIKQPKGLGPTIKNDTWKFKETVLPAANRLTLNQRCFSKKLPLAEARQINIEQMIDGLAQHPLALYPHLEEFLPPDLFEEVLSILDPEINQHAGQSDSALFDDKYTTPNMKGTEENGVARKNIRDEILQLEESLIKEKLESREQSARKNVKNTYKWLLKKDEAKLKAKGPDPEQLKAQAIDSHIKKATEEYCEWVRSLGGEHNIDPVTLTSLFASGYDTKPPLSVPIHVVELTNIPVELRSTAYVPLEPNHEPEPRNIFRDVDNPHNAASFRYGAWYLPKQHWRYMSVAEKLVDPKSVKDTEKEGSRRRAEDINSKLAPLHGAQAFKQFVQTKQPSRIPKLLSELDEWKNEQAATKVASPSADKFESPSAS